MVTGVRVFYIGFCPKCAEEEIRYFPVEDLETTSSNYYICYCHHCNEEMVLRRAYAE